MMNEERKKKLNCFYKLVTWVNITWIIFISIIIATLIVSKVDKLSIVITLGIVLLATILWNQFIKSINIAEVINQMVTRKFLMKSELKEIIPIYPPEGVSKLKGTAYFKYGYREIINHKILIKDNRAKFYAILNSDDEYVRIYRKSDWQKDEVFIGTISSENFPYFFDIK